jgi:hypothetical protein
MNYGDEFIVDVPPGFDLELTSVEELSSLFLDARRITRFNSTPDQSFTHDQTPADLQGSLCYKIDQDGLIEINNSFLRTGESAYCAE